MATTRGRRKGDNPLTITAALKFVDKTLRSDREHKQQHCFISRGMLSAFDGTLTVGHPVAEDIEACPHTGRLLAAMKQCDATGSLTLRDSSRLTVQSGKFRVTLECLPPGALYVPAADPPLYVADDNIKAGFAAISHITDDNADKVAFATIFVKNGTMAATDGKTILEYWHGCNLPSMVLPKSACQAVGKHDKKLVKFGFSGASATFHFEDQSWIRTQLYKDAWPVYSFIDKPSNAWPVPPGLFDAVRAVLPFVGQYDAVFFKTESIASHMEEDHGATFEVPGLQAGPKFSAKQLLQIEAACKSVDFSSHPGHAYFFGDKIRGVIVGMRINAAPVIDAMDDDIPF